METAKCPPRTTLCSQVQGSCAGAGSDAVRRDFCLTEPSEGGVHYTTPTHSKNLISISEAGSTVEEVQGSTEVCNQGDKMV